ncbi:Na+/H+ antiporter [Weissella coleopterorum]|uniref:Na+/H+ antiporter n=1 Tax=Weissella coleopterorum TaxID=2714949 RepID=A0A6G8AZG6_9LACO|nr:Na+/H+ antiporter [Weissella coleopterorum]QIL50352.1 Na+/H+ antiporter [Weissella coleopterorum]
MELIETGVALLGIVLIGNLISHLLPKLPVSLIEILLGLIVAVFFKVQITLDTSWFLLLFIAPLLYSDAWRFPKRELWALRGPIFGNAIILVLLTTVLGGFLIYTFVPELSLSVSFALAAILSPTDPVAVQAIAKSVKLPSKLLHLVSGESLINDASGLVAFKFALAAAVTGTFSLWQATNEFLYTALVGALIGAIIISIINFILDYIGSRGIHDVVFVVVLQLFSPFVIYLVAEHFHTSGVIAVVVGAIISNLHTKNNVNYTGELHVVGLQTWDVLGYLFNGAIFVLLGIELPVAMENFAANTGKLALPMVFLYAILTWLIIFLIRVFWTYGNQFWRFYRHKQECPTWKMAIISGLSGVRGAVTMAGVLSVPLVLSDGQTPFPARGLMLFISATVIIISLLAAVTLLPIVSKHGTKPTKKTSQVAQHMSEPRAHVYILQSAMRIIEQQYREENAALIYEIVLEYQHQIRQLQLENMNSEALNPILEAEVRLRKIALEAELTPLKQLLNTQKISEFVYNNEIQRIERLENNLNYIVQKPGQVQLWRRTKYLTRMAWRSVKIWWTDEDNQQIRDESALAQFASGEAAIKALEYELECMDKKRMKREYPTTHNLIISYQNRINQSRQTAEQFEKSTHLMRLDLELVGLKAQREAIQHLFAAHFISFETNVKLRQGVNYSEAALLTNETR